MLDDGFRGHLLIKSDSVCGPVYVLARHAHIHTGYMCLLCPREGSRYQNRAECVLVHVRVNWRAKSWKIWCSLIRLVLVNALKLILLDNWIELGNPNCTIIFRSIGGVLLDLEIASVLIEPLHWGLVTDRHCWILVDLLSWASIHYPRVNWSVVFIWLRLDSSF